MNLEALPGSYARALRLAWAATVAGTVGVGAVIQGPDGAVLGEGQNQIFSAGPGVLVRNRLAHAEMNAIAACREGTSLAGATVWTTLEPCIMCAGALVLSKVAYVNVLSVDPFQSEAVEVLSKANEWVERSWPRKRWSSNLSSTP